TAPDPGWSPTPPDLSGHGTAPDLSGQRAAADLAGHRAAPPLGGPRRPPPLPRPLVADDGSGRPRWRAPRGRRDPVGPAFTGPAVPSSSPAVASV
ncbi:hypothetical protein ACFXMU_38450, partial [Streptomyces sp. NPDC059185]